MKNGDYMIYKLINEKGNEVIKFYQPDCLGSRISLRRKAYRLLDLAQCRNDGYSLYAVAYVDEETYLNARLDQRVKEFCQLDLDEQELLRNTWNVYDIEEDLHIIQECKQVALRQISLLIRRIIRGEFNVNNEIALQLYEAHMKGII